MKRLVEAFLFVLAAVLALAGFLATLFGFVVLLVALGWLPGDREMPISAFVVATGTTLGGPSATMVGLLFVKSRLGEVGDLPARRSARLFLCFAGLGTLLTALGAVTLTILETSMEWRPGDARSGGIGLVLALAAVGAAMLAAGLISFVVPSRRPPRSRQPL